MCYFNIPDKRLCRHGFDPSTLGKRGNYRLVFRILKFLAEISVNVSARRVFRGAKVGTILKRPGGHKDKCQEKARVISITN